ncbi:MAG: HEAT repeat domain-containing protein [Bacteroidaceae bacterium]|nr:HEAT repeat domain-containing protein [Bacteroidaceae bacterium]
MRLLRLLYLLAAAVVLCPAKGIAARRGFAIVIDPQSLAQARTEVEAYAQAIEQRQGLRVYTIVDQWGVPDSIRHCLQTLYTQKQDPIVGCVLVGDIPVPMVRDAQHMTSAFKMNQTANRRDSSVPSDRFYDDFKLAFRYLDRDTAQWSHLFYYSLTAEGTQRLQPDIFSGRIRPTDAKGESRYEKLRRYLRKATEWKRNPDGLNTMLVFNGSGSLSESNVAHIDEFRGLAEHFPEFAEKPESFSYMEYTEEPYIEKKLMNELMRPELSVAMLHHHGDFDTQYLSNYPKPRTLAEAIEYIRYQARDHRRTYIRRGMEPDSALARVLRQGVPQDWLSDAGEAERERQDSILVEQTNITLADFGPEGLRPNVRLSIFDACYNGAFHNEDCIANEYIFQTGKALVGLGGTVNVLQDKWADHFLGLMADGMMVGFLGQYYTYLEWHVIGDPTFCFAPRQGAPAVNQMLATWSDKQWLKVLDKKASADLQCMAIFKNSLNPQLSDERLLRLLRTSPLAMVRLEAFQALKRRGGDSFVEAMQTASHDNYEMIQRFAVNEMQVNGDPRIVPSIARLVARNNTSARVRFNALQSLQFLDGGLVRKAVAEEVDRRVPYVLDPQEYRKGIDKSVDSYCNRWDEDIDELTQGKLDEKKALRQANYMRIYLPPYKIPAVCDFVRTCGNAPLQRDLLEALGWHGTAYTAPSIRQLCEQLTADETLDPEVRAEALKTLKRIKG